MISDKEIQKLVNATCQHKSCTDRKNAVAKAYNERSQGQSLEPEFNRYLSFIGSSTRPGLSELTNERELQKMNVLPGLYNMGNTCFANSVI